MKKGFQIAEFPESTDARWGFYGPGGREVAVLRYPTVELANTNGLQAAQEQTEYIEPIEGITAYGDKVEKTTCRGFADYPPPYKVTQEKNLSRTYLEKMIANLGLEEHLPHQFI